MNTPAQQIIGNFIDYAMRLATGVFALVSFWLKSIELMLGEN